jgi:hypothetical protein
MIISKKKFNQLIDERVLELLDQRIPNEIVLKKLIQDNQRLTISIGSVHGRMDRLEYKIARLIMAGNSVLVVRR